MVFNVLVKCLTNKEKENLMIKVIGHLGGRSGIQAGVDHGFNTIYTHSHLDTSVTGFLIVLLWAITNYF